MTNRLMIAAATLALFSATAMAQAPAHRVSQNKKVRKRASR
jgi:hypothetical protein